MNECCNCKKFYSFFDANPEIILAMMYDSCLRGAILGKIVRLTEKAKTILVDVIRKYFSQVEKIILFGSRIDDSKRGGDIDILVQTPAAFDAAFEAKLRTVAALQLELGEQRIDLLITTGTDDERLIVKNAYRQGIVLWTK